MVTKHLLMDRLSVEVGFARGIEKAAQPEAVVGGCPILYPRCKQWEVRYADTRLFVVCFKNSIHSLSLVGMTHFQNTRYV